MPGRPAGLSRGEQGILGKPLPRIEGRTKVTGKADYAYERAPDDPLPDDILYAAIVGTPVGAGEITGIDASAAEALESPPPGRCSTRPIQTIRIP